MLVPQQHEGDSIETQRYSPSYVTMVWGWPKSNVPRDAQLSNKLETHGHLNIEYEHVWLNKLKFVVSRKSTAICSFTEVTKWEVQLQFACFVCCPPILHKPNTDGQSHRTYSNTQVFWLLFGSACCSYWEKFKNCQCDGSFSDCVSIIANTNSGHVWP